jgi:myo-inositol catabolism protein IolC
VAARASSFAGFAVGRSIWTAPLGDLLARRIDHERTVARIAAGYAAIAEGFRSTPERILPQPCNKQ